MKTVSGREKAGLLISWNTKGLREEKTSDGQSKLRIFIQGAVLTIVGPHFWISSLLDGYPSL